MVTQKKRNAAIPHKEALNNLLNAAVIALSEPDYKTYIRSLDNLGNFLNHSFQEQDSRFFSKTASEVKKAKLAWLPGFLGQPSFAIGNPLNYCIFEEAWIDEPLRHSIYSNGTQRFLREYSPKAHLNLSTRRSVNLGMHALGLAFKPIDNSHRIQLAELSNINLNVITERDKLAASAIASYKNKKQRYLEHGGRAFAVIMSVVCSILTAGAVAITIAAWPIPIAGAITALVFVVFVTINWLSFRSSVPRMLQDVFGKDTFLEGWLNYNDPKTGEKKRMMIGRKICLALSALLSTAVGIATGAITYGFVLGLSKLGLFSAIFVSTFATACLPPLGIAIATVFCIASIVLMMKSALNIIHAKNFKSIFTDPFKNIAMIFDPVKHPNKNPWHLKIAKRIAYGLLAFVTVIAFVGLVLLQVQNAVAISNFLSQSLAVSSAIGLGIAYSLSMAAVIIKKLPDTMSSVVEGLVWVVTGCRNLFAIFRHPEVKERKDKNIIVNFGNNLVEKTKKTIDEMTGKDIQKKAAAERIVEVSQILQFGQPKKETFGYGKKSTKLKERNSHLFFEKHKKHHHGSTLTLKRNINRHMLHS